MTDALETAFQQVEDSPKIKEKLRQVDTGKSVVSFDHVSEGAQPFVAALIARHAFASGRRVWIFCENERAQESFHFELSCWLPGAVLFPHLEIAAVEGAIPDPEINAERLGVLQRLSKLEGGTAVVLNRRSLDEAVPPADRVARATLEMQKGQRIDRGKILEQLEGAGYENVPQISERGQFSVRGGILDIYSWQQTLPLRLEWFDDEIESIREFEIDDQTSVGLLDRCAVLLEVPEGKSVQLRSYLTKSDLTVSVGANHENTRVIITTGISENTEDAEEYYGDAFYRSPLDLTAVTGSSPSLTDLVEARTLAQLKSWSDEQYTLVIHYSKFSEQTSVEQIVKVLTPRIDKLFFNESSVGSSFVYPFGKLAVLSAAEILGSNLTLVARRGLSAGSRRGLLKQRTQIDFTELSEGDLVVHLEHGLARFLGIENHGHRSVASSNQEEATHEVMILEFAEHAKLFVPLEQAFLVSRYVGLGKRGAALSHLGDGKWSSTKKAAEKSIYDYAAQLLKIQAVRELHPGFVFGPDGAWQREFEDEFPYKETADQVRAINDTKADMESGLPMDRLICGDVGFGKTEVAIRAAFKAATSGKQVAMMVPTTVLAQQHYETFSNRMAKFPVVVELLSRYRSRAEQTRVAHGLRDGSVDIVIGTHRLISKDVEFKDLGLLVVDEEQRFGVRHKERIKERFPNVDVVTLSATPIPRTLYMALTGARALSTLETPPPNRYPVETVICAFDERVIRTAIDRELDRQGQVYFLHNRVEDIERVRARIKHLCPQAKVDLGHGQMEEGELEAVMHRFVSGETNVLVATTIIESGLDIPNANTIIIDRADRFGLADLYQLRGRVGRGSHKAYAYLMLPRDLLTVGEARKRINAIKQYSALGAGFKIALRDLEIRGAGNILGVAQSGHLTAVGFDLYCQLLRQAVGKLKGEKARPRAEVTLRLDFVATSEMEFLRRSLDNTAPVDDNRAPSSAEAPETPEVWPAFIPASYIEEPRLRIQAYRQLAGVNRQDEVESLRESWRDRFGRLPVATENLLLYTRFKLLAASRKLQQVELRGSKLMLTRGADFVLIGGRFPRLTSTEPVTKMRELFTLVETL